MRQLVNDFPTFLKEALSIGKNSSLKKYSEEIRNVVITGLGGSGIGGTIVSQVLASKCRVPIFTNKDYDLPKWVDKHTLVIASSYSGNTEETIASVEKSLTIGAEIACVTSGGKLKEMAEENDWNRILIPPNNPPRSMFAYSFTQLFFLLSHYGLCSIERISELNTSQILLEKNNNAIESDALRIAKTINNKTIAIYSDSAYEGVGVRYRQQINENSKQLCWHHALPEMNHNELVGWAGGSKDIAVLMLRSDNDHERTKLRMDLCRDVFKNYTDTVVEIHSVGNSTIERSMYLILLGDWISIHLAELNNVDPVEIKVINYLKGELAKSL